MKCCSAMHFTTAPTTKEWIHNAPDLVGAATFYTQVLFVLFSVRKQYESWCSPLPFICDRPLAHPGSENVEVLEKLHHCSGVSFHGLPSRPTLLLMAYTSWTQVGLIIGISANSLGQSLSDLLCNASLCGFDSLLRGARPEFVILLCLVWSLCLHALCKRE